MKQFILRILLFLVIFLSIITSSLFLITNKRLKNSSLYADVDKNRRLDSLPSPKIVFVGGSNIAFGLNSKEIEDSIHLPVVNMGLHAGLGISFMLNEIRDHVNKGDIVVFSPEYHQFFGNLFYGEKVLVALLFDINHKDLSDITLRQYIYLFPDMVKYATSKLLFLNLDMAQDGGDEYGKVFKRNSFNKYGDEAMHWNFPLHEILMKSTPGKNIQIEPNTLLFIKNFKYAMDKKGVAFYIIPSAFQKASFIAYHNVIREIGEELAAQSTPFEIQPKEFSYPDNMMFNSIYHLNKLGVDQRTLLIINFLKSKTRKVRRLTK